MRISSSWENFSIVSDADKLVIARAVERIERLGGTVVVELTKQGHRVTVIAPVGPHPRQLRLPGEIGK